MILSKLARLGYASAGLVYMIVGALTVAAGLGKRKSGSGSHDAFLVILDQPFGRIALIVIAFGLTGYALWRLVSGVTDSEHRGSDPKGLAIRAGSIGRGLIYAAFTIEVVRLITRGRGGGQSGGDQQTQHWTSRLLDAPFGPWLVGAIGLGVVIYGAYQLWAAWDAKLSKRLHLGEIDARVRRKVIAISRFGLGARGIVFFVAGGSLVLAAVRHDPSEAHGTAGSLAILPQPMLIVIGIGLIAYGVYALVNARYRDIR
ncbi:MAG TPA: DUF1206 domain-containing protein [Thermoanaerobaculia bacterium]|nr:DUF1206 domain-containing protein [Thermoanaerobaculia bacterium]